MSESRNGFHKVDGVSVQFWTNPEMVNKQIKCAEHAHAVHNVRERLETVADLLRAQGFTATVTPMAFAWEMTGKRYAEDVAHVQ